VDRLAAMEVFLRVVDLGNFSAAARRLGISKAMASRHVRQLEDHLGARLLNRTTRQIRLTEIGAAYYERCARIVADIDETEHSVMDLQSEPRGTLKISAPMSFGVLHLAPAIFDYMSRYPKVTVDLTLNDGLVDLIHDGYDLAIRIGRLADSTLIARRMVPARLVVCGSPSYLEKHGVPREPEDLSRYNCLTYSFSPSPGEWQFKGREGDFPVRVSGNFRANNGDTLRLAALHGLGLVKQPTFIIGEDLRTGRLRAVLTEYEATPRSIFAVYPHARHVSAKVRSFIDFLAERCCPEPYWDNPADQESGSAG
jgi:DNA-binding transcriptional LysR family regulator